jgi:hypothetical protein
MTTPDDTLLSFMAALPLAADAPTMTAQLALRIASRAIHLLCAIILGGGVFYLRSVLAHAGPEASFAGRRAVWARWVAAASAFLLATGMYNYIMIVRDAKVPGARELPTTYHMLFGVKFLLGLLVMFIAAILAGKTAAADRARAAMARWLNVAWMSVIAIVVIAAFMRSMH